MRMTVPYPITIGGPNRELPNGYPTSSHPKRLFPDATVYWYDDAPWGEGGCRIPQSWKMYYKDAQGQWQPVSGADKYGGKRYGNTVNFDPVKTKAVKLEVVQPADNSSGLFEWEVK